MKPLRFGIVGAGHLGRIHTRLLKELEGVEVVGVVDTAADARARVAAEFDTAEFASHLELLDRIDAAVVATTTEHHSAVGVDLLSHGIHVLLEKPIAPTVRQADALVTAAADNQCVLQVGHVERFNGAWTAAAPFIRRPLFIESVRTSGYTFRSTDIGVVLDLMIHDLDLVLSAVPSKVVEVDATGATIFGPHEDMAHAHLRFENGCIATLNASRTSFQAQRSMQVVAERAYVGIDFAAPSAKLIRPRKELLRGQIDVRHMPAEQRQRIQHNLFTDLLPVRELKVAPTNAIQQEQIEFVQSIRHGTRPRVTGAEARDHLVIAERILEQIGSSPLARRLQDEASSSRRVA